MSLVHDPVGQIDRNGKAVAGVEPGLAGDGGVHADHFAPHAHQRAAGVARVDGGVGLNEVLNAAVALAREGKAAALGADDAGGHREGQVVSQRITHRENPLPDPGGAAVAQRGGHQVPGVDLEHREVGVRIGARRSWP